MTSRRALLAWWADEDPPARVTLDRSACLTSFADFCATCVERCPVEGAILLVGRHPVVQEACTGCGVCIPLCPAPKRALSLSPDPP